jgi:hypothetical protein
MDDVGMTVPFVMVTNETNVLFVRTVRVVKSSQMGFAWSNELYRGRCCMIMARPYGALF